MKILPALLGVCATSLVSQGALGADSSTCTQDGLSRTVSIVYSEPGQAVPCEVMYEKSGEGQSMTLWRAQNEAGYCEARAAEFVAKLAGMGWACSAVDAGTLDSSAAQNSTAADIEPAAEGTTEATATDAREG